MPPAAAAHLQRFTGSALTGLASFAASVGEQMEKNAAQAAAEAEAQKKVRGLGLRVVLILCNIVA